MRRLACLAALLSSAVSGENLKQIIQNNVNGRHNPLTNSNLIDDADRQKYCLNDLQPNSFVGVQKSTDQLTTINDGVRSVTPLTSTDECSVATLTCKDGSFFPPRATCKQNQCEQWESPVSSNNKFGKIAEVSEAQSYLYTEGNTKKVKVTVYVNKRWFDNDFADVEVYLRSNANGAPKFRYNSSGSENGWVKSSDTTAAANRLFDAVPTYFKTGGNPCVVALQRDITWAEWVRELDSSPAAGWNGDDTLNVNQIVVTATSRQEYVQWDKRLPDVTDKDLKQEVEQVLNVVIRYPHTVLARTPVFTLTDEKHVDVQVTSLRIEDVKWGVSEDISGAAETEFTFRLELESQVQAPFKLANIDVIGKPNDGFSLAGSGPERMENGDCELASSGDAFVSSNGRFFGDEDKPVQICSQKWQLDATVTLDGRCEFPTEFGFSWDVNCASKLYDGADCPLKNGADAFMVRLSELVDSDDVLWICPHMISEHPVHTRFRTYRRDATAVDNRPIQEVFVAGETLYADIDLYTNWGFLEIESATMQSLKINYDRSFSSANWADAPAASKCGTGNAGTVVGKFCEYELIRNTSQTTLARRIAYGGEVGGTERQYAMATSNGEANRVGCYNDDVIVDVPGGSQDAKKTACEQGGNHWGTLFNTHHYKLGFNFELKQDVFPEPYKMCDAKRWDKDTDRFTGSMKGDNYQKQEYLGAEGRYTGQVVENNDDVKWNQGDSKPQLTPGTTFNPVKTAQYQNVVRHVQGVSNDGKFILRYDCEFNQGTMNFLAVVEVDYGDAGRRRLLIEGPLHHKGITARTSIALESPSQVAYEEALDVAALQPLTVPATPRTQSVEQVQMLAQQDEPPPPAEDWTGPVKGVALGGVAVVLLLMLICYIHKKERKRHKDFDDSMEGLLKKYKPRSDDAESILERPVSRVRIKEPEKPLLGEKIEEHDEDTVPDQGIIVQHPQPTAIAAFGEDAPDPDDLPPVPTHRRPGPDDTVSLGVPPTQRASSTAPNSCRGTILHAVHSVQSVPSYRQPSLQSVTSARSVTSNTTQDQRNGAQSATLSSATVRSHITSKRGTEERDPTVTMSTCTDYVIDRGPDAPAPPV